MQFEGGLANADLLRPRQEKTSALGVHYKSLRTFRGTTALIPSTKLRTQHHV